MALTATWVHGNALTVETPDNCAAINHQGWGTDLFIKPGTRTWFHIPISTPVLINDVRAQLVRAFILFETNPGDGFISNVHVYDGPFKPQEFKTFISKARIGLASTARTRSRSRSHIASHSESALAFTSSLRWALTASSARS